jgi:hypothetical protein
MSNRSTPPQQSDPSFGPMMRSLMLELIIYGPLVTIYFLIVIFFGKDLLLKIYAQQPLLYSIVTLAVIVAQGVLLEALTSWLLRKIGLRH